MKDIKMSSPSNTCSSTQEFILNLKDKLPVDIRQPVWLTIFHKSRSKIRRLSSLFHRKKISCGSKTFAIGYSRDIYILKAYNLLFFLWSEHILGNVLVTLGFLLVKRNE